MRFHFTKHAHEKIKLLTTFGFHISPIKIKQTIKKPLKTERRNDGTLIATTLLDSSHVLRVVYRTHHDIIVIITFYPGRKKSYGL